MAAPAKAPAPARDAAWQQQFIDNYWLGLGDVSQIETPNPFLLKSPEPPHVFCLDLMRRPENFGFTVKTLFDKQLAPFQMSILKELWVRPFPMLVGSRGLGKSWILAVYCMLRALFNQGVKIVIVGAAFRQAKVVFDYCQELWESGPVLRDLVGTDKKNGPRRDVDRCTLRMGDSLIIALPLGDGCVTSDTLTTYGNRFGTIADDRPELFGPVLAREVEVWGNGEFRRSDEAYFNGRRPTKRVTTAKGYVLEGTHNHKVRVLRGEEVVWERLDTIRPSDHVLVDRSSRWHSGESGVSVDESYALGLMIGDGCWTDPYRLGYATQDDELIDAVRRGTGLSFPGWSEADPLHFNHYGKQDRTDWLRRWGLKSCQAHEKVLPPTILSASREAMSACLRGLFDTDGHVQVQTAKGGTGVTVGLTSTSERLARQVHYVLLHYGIVSTLSSRDRGKANWRTAWELLITGRNAARFAEMVGFGLARKAETLEAGLAAKARETDQSDGVPGVAARMAEVASSQRVKRGQGSADTVAVSAGRLRKRKRVGYETVAKFLSVYGGRDHAFSARLASLANPDVYYDEVATVEDGEADTYDMHVPVGHEYCANGFYSHNTKIRGQRGNIIVSDEFASISKDIFETVVRGFGAVSQNPVDKMQAESRKAAIQELGLWTDAHGALEESVLLSNQTVISGTAYYSFNHFYDYWRRYKAIVESRGNPRKLEDIFGGRVPDKFNWKDYSVIRIPVDKLPPGMMDEKQIAQARATIHSGTFGMEYSAIFSADSEGFFRRSLVETCVVGRPGSPISLPSVGEVRFSAVIRGVPGRRYVMAVDPASERDNFSITVLECWDDHRRIVFGWTTTRARHKAKVKRGLVQDQDFYAYAARKVRELLVAFPCDRVAIDSQGGGVAVMEALQDEARLLPGERKILPVIDPDAPKDTDGVAGDHIVEVVNFSNAEWVSQANHGLRKDFEDKALLFPEFDPATLAMSHEDDKEAGRVVVDQRDASVEKLYDTLEDAVLEIEDLKDELASIVHTQTGTSGRDRWDTPEVKGAGGKKGRLRKDRYSSLLMANMVARTLQRAPREPEYKPAGGFARDIGRSAADGKGRPASAMWVSKGGDGGWWAEQARLEFGAGRGYGAVVKRAV